jgi:hypothetical protein
MNLFGDDWEQAIVPSAPEIPVEKSVNPCIDAYGPGPAGAICRDCVHLQSATWYKCDMRAWKSKGGKNAGTVYPGGDHRVRWKACARFELRPDELKGV